MCFSVFESIHVEAFLNLKLEKEKVSFIFIKDSHFLCLFTLCFNMLLMLNGEFSHTQQWLDCKTWDKPENILKKLQAKKRPKEDIRL